MFDCSEVNLYLLLVAFGGFVVLKVLLRFSRWVLNMLSLYGFKTYVDFRKYGEWAVITGGSNGIGKGFALELAKRGMNIIIIDYAEKELKKTTSEIETKFGVETKGLVIDFRGGREIYRQMESFLKDLDVGILINNVGIAHPVYNFDEIEDCARICDDMCRINVVSVLRMTQLVLPGMKSRKRGLIMNMSSFSAIRPVPILSVYGATKSFVDYFSRAISIENEGSGVEIMSIKPYFVRTNICLNHKWDFFTGDVTPYVTSCLATVGKQLKETHGCFLHEVMAFILGNASEWYLLKRMKDTQVMWRQLFAKSK